MIYRKVQVKYPQLGVKQLDEEIRLFNLILILKTTK